MKLRQMFENLQQIPHDESKFWFTQILRRICESLGIDFDYDDEKLNLGDSLKSEPRLRVKGPTGRNGGRHGTYRSKK